MTVKTFIQKLFSPFFKIQVRRLKFHTVLTLCIAIILGCSAAALSYSQILYEPDEYVTNYLYTYNPIEKADSRITILAIDSASEAQYGAYENWSRELLAQAVTKLSNDNASVIALDTDLSEEKDRDGDLALVNASKQAGNVIAMASASFDTLDISKKTDVYDSFMPSPADSTMKWREHSAVSIRFPYDALNEAVTVGISNTTQASADGSIRSAALSLSFQETVLESFASIVYRTYQKAHGLDCIFPELDEQNLFGFNQIWDTTSYQVISFSDYLAGNYASSLIDDHIILIGEYTAAPSANYIDYIRFDHKKYQEILLEAGILQALLTQRVIYNVNRTLQALLYGFGTAILYLFLIRRKGFFAFLFPLFLLLLSTGFAYALNASGHRLLLLVPILFTLAALMISLLQKLLYNIIERHRMERTMKLYMDSQIVDQITEVSPFELTHLSERRQIAVLFVDIRGFTSLSEELDPADVVEVLNQYFTIVYAAIQAWNGTLDKFIGDAAMAIFNAPAEHEDYIFHAVCAADDIIKSFEPIRQAFFKKYGKEIHVGIGVNCGEAIVGNIGCMRRMDYTAIGDTVNTASRLESQAAPDQILVSESMLEALGERARVSFVGALNLKGKTNTVDTYQLNSIDKPTPPNLSARKEFLNEARLLYSKMGANRPITAFLEKIPSRL